MLQLYDINKNKIEGLTEYKDLNIESTLSTGDKVLSFLYPTKFCKNIVEEGYIQTKTDEFVIKEKNNSGIWTTIKAVLNVEDLEGNVFETFDSTEQTIENCLNLALAGTGWTVKVNGVTKKRTVRKTNSSTWDIIQQAKKTYRVEIKFDTINKIVKVYEKIGSDKGAYFTEELNLKSLDIQSNSYDFYTRMIAKGKDDLKVTVENYQYSNKVKTLIWKDERYTDINSLREDAILKLDELSKPYRAYQADVIDLARISEKYKNILEYSLGDTITLISKDNEIKEKQRIVKITEYPDEPERNTVEIANTTLTFEDVQKEFQDTSEVVNNITADDGTISETALRVPVERLTINKVDVQELNAVTARVGTLEATKANITELNAVNANLTNLIAGKADITDLTATNIKFNVGSGATLDLQTLLSKFVTGENGQFLNLTTDNVTISNAVIKDIIAKNISVEDLKAGTINTNNINLVSADGGLSIVGPTMQFKDNNNKVRLQLGKDTEGDFNFILRAADGTTTLIDGYGIKENAIADKLIKSNMVADGAIGEQQINYSSLITGLNKDTNTSLIKASKVALDLTGQTLEVSFNSLKSVADDTKSKTESNTTSINVINGQIATLIIDTTIEEDGATVKLKDSYSNLKQTVSGINATIASHSTSISNLTNNLNAVSGKVTTVEGKQATLEQSLNGFKTTVANTYSTKTELNNLSGTVSSINSRVSTAESSINQLNDKIALKVEATEVNNIVNTAVNGIKINIRNLVIRSNELKNKIIDVNGNIINFTGCAVMFEYISVSSGEVLTFSKTNSVESDGYWRWKWLDAEGEYISRQADIRNEFQWTVPPGAYFIQVSYPMDAFPKIERGNKPTGWSPAPEDVYKKNEVDNLIKTGDLYVKGTGNNRPDSTIIRLNGNDIYKGKNRGLTLVTLKRSDLTVVDNISYDVFGSGDARNALANKLNGLDDSVIVILASYDAIETNQALQDAIARCGGTGTFFGGSFHRVPYALVGIPNIGKGAGIEVFTSTDANAPYAEINTKIINGVPQGINTTARELMTRISSAELKITDSAIVSTVRSSTLYQNDLNAKASKTDVSNLTTRVNSVEQSITATALTTTISSALSGSNSITTTKFTMDKDGLTIKNGGFKILNTSNYEVFGVTTEGILTVKGNIFVNGDTGESLEVTPKEKIGNGMPSVYADGYGLGVLRLMVGYYDSLNKYIPPQDITTKIDPYTGVTITDNVSGGSTSIIGGKISSRIIEATGDIYNGSYSKNTNGYTKLPNGLILQWGKATTVNTPDKPGWTVFPIAFPNNCFAVVCSIIDYNPARISVREIFKSGFNHVGSVNNAPIVWIAIGY